MDNTYFYHNTIKSLISAFGILFKGVQYKTDFGDIRTVALHYAPKEKFQEFIAVKTEYDGEPDVDLFFPRMGFMLNSVIYDSMRMSNPLSKFVDRNNAQNRYILNRIPYNFEFTLWVGTKKFEDSLQIIEQIIPFFTPELNISIKDKADFGTVTDVPITLVSSQFEIDWEGSFETRRTILWTLNFTAKAWLYSNVRNQKRIQETIVNMTQDDVDEIYRSLTSEIEPRTASRVDPHTVVDQRYDGPSPAHFTLKMTEGSESWNELQNNVHIDTSIDEYGPLPEDITSVAVPEIFSIIDGRIHEGAHAGAVLSIYTILQGRAIEGSSLGVTL